MHEKLFALYAKIKSHVVHNVDRSKNQILAFGIIMTVNYPVYYLIWAYASLQSYENLGLRLSASFFSFLLIVARYWPVYLKRFLPMYWYFTATYCLPFFFTFMTLKNHASAMWLMNGVSVLFFLMLLFDLASVVLLLIIGIGAAFIVYKIGSPSSFVFLPGVVDFNGIIVTLAAAFLMGAIFAYHKEKSQKERLNIIVTVGESIAHELRTPLRTIQNSAQGII